MSQPSARAEQLFKDQYYRVRIRISAAHIWERLLTPADRDQLGGDFDRAFREVGTIGMWTAVKGVSQKRAVIDLASVLGFMSGADHAWLLREFDELPNPSDIEDPTHKPFFDARLGQLRLGNEKIRKVAVRKTKTQVAILLSAFQSAGWPTSIPQPFHPALKQSQISQLLTRLNERPDQDPVS